MTLWHLLVFELKHNIKNIYQYIYIYCFFIFTLLIFIFCAPSETGLAPYGHIPAWLAIISGTLLLGPSCFAQDDEQGIITHISLSPVALEGYVLAKFIVLSALGVAPATALLPLMESQGTNVAGLYSVLPLAGLTMIALVMLAAAITTGIRKAGATMQLLVLPWAVSVMIFASEAARAESAINSAGFWFLCGMTGVVLPLTLLISAAALRGR